MPSRPSSFDTLRSWRGSQSRAFEELSFQLLKGDVPPRAEAVRTGNPDGGVEWYATLDDGSEYGWQAKHIRDFDTLLSAMTATVRRVVLDRQALVRLTFVISSNLTTGTRGGKTRSQRQKYEAKVHDWKSTIDGAARIEFALIQESDLLDKLTEPKHRGRQWFWWRSPVFDEDWLQARHVEQSDAAGERYRPDLQVDLPIEEDLKSLGFADSPVEHFERLCGDVVSSGREMRLTPSGSEHLVKLYRAIEASAQSLISICASTVPSPPSIEANLRLIQDAGAKFLDAVEAAEVEERDLERARRQSPAGQDDREEKQPPDVARSYSVRRLRNSTGELAAWLDSFEGRAMQERFYFLVGPAGSGKTHLFLDAMRRAIDDRRPSVVLFGARFGKGNLWDSVCDQLGLDPVGADVLLGAMDSAGEATSLRGTRFVILVDALNETVPPDFWLSHLPALRAAVARWPHVALAVSCRDTYVDLVDDGTEQDNYIVRTHPGFVGREIEATHKYFAHYDLEAPRIPLLVPEFTLPLFLRMYCESLRDSGESAALAGHEGRVRTFERYIEAKLKRVARRLRPSAGSTYELQRANAQASGVVSALLDELASLGTEGISITRAEELATSAADGSAKDAGVILGALQDEGVLTRERLYLGSGAYDDGLRIAFQAFSDFLLLKRRLAVSSDPMNDTVFREWLSETASWGIVEAGAVTLPELYQVELPDLLGFDKRSLSEPSRDNDSAWRRYRRAERVYRSVVKTLPYREAAAISERTIELLNEAMPLLSYADLFHTMIRIAPQPANPLNADALHGYLLRFKMPRRDATFGIATYRDIWDESAPTSTLARWASGGPYPHYNPDVVELACVPLVWLLSSSNRHMRDWVTKALVQLLRGHLDVLLRLLDRFWSIDDPYVVQRVVAISYGALMRSDESTTAEARELAARVHQLVFTQPVRADELLLDAARGIVELGVHRGLLPKESLRDIKRPYGITPPANNPPTEETLRKKYGYREDQRDEESYSTIYSSILSMGDFGRYVVESGVGHFSRYKYGEDFPDQTPWPEPRFVRARWKRFEDSLSKMKRAALEDLTLNSADGGEPDEAALRLDDFYSTLSTPQQELLHDCWQRPRPKFRNDGYPTDRARRWALRRTLSLGWTPQLFGREDRIIGHSHSDRGAHKAERWGKKYQWMAYHELLARVADNYQPARRHTEDGPYEGLHQIIAEREIDPSLPPIEYRELTDRPDEGAPTWQASPVLIPDWPPGQLDFGRYHADITEFIEDQDSEPALDRTAVLTDAAGIAWVLLDALITQSDPSGETSWLGLRQDLALDAWFVPRNQASALLAQMPVLRKNHHWDLVDTHGHIDCCYYGEIGWTPHSCYHAHRTFDEVEFDGHAWQFAPAVETYLWEGSLLDSSISASVQTTLPSSFVQSRSELARIERGPSWVDPDGALAFTNLELGSDRGSAFMVRAGWLRDFLDAHEVELVIATWCERRYLDRNHTNRHPSEEVHAAARIDATLTVHSADVIRERR